MKSNTTGPYDRTTPETVSPTTVFGALSRSRRQHALQYLVQKPGAVALGDVAEYIAIEEGTTTRDRYERILTGLYHTHVPYLTDTGLVRYDADRETVSLLVEPASLLPYLDLARRAPLE